VPFEKGRDEELGLEGSESRRMLLPERRLRLRSGWEEDRSSWKELYKLAGPRLEDWVRPSSCPVS
jgi:hypothetical protein